MKPKTASPVPVRKSKMVASDRIQVTTMNFLNAQKQSIFDDSDTYFDYLSAAKINIKRVEAFGHKDPIGEDY
ncbi:MAG: hypothetical protein WAV96_01465 [Trichococcus flocculiformis]|nr:hypothetical protein [Candidatus Brachybacter algidus]